MKKVPPQNLFGLFDISDEDILQKESEEFIKEDFFIFGSVVKGLEQYALLDEIYGNKYGDVYTMFAENIKYRYYNKLYSKLKELKLYNLDSFQINLNTIGIETSVKSLNILLNFFIEIEEYEKCVEIKKFLDLIENLSKKS